MASGTTTSTAQTRRPGRLVRSTHQAAAVPMTAHSTVTTTVSRTVFHSRSAVSRRKIRWATVAAPAPRASMSRKTSGSASTQATARLAAISATGGRARRARTAGRGAGRLAGRGRRPRPPQRLRRRHRPSRPVTAARPARISAIAVAPSPSSAIVIG